MNLSMSYIGSGMAFLYPVGVKVERYEDDFHFWYVNGFRPDPAIKQEVVGEKPKEEMNEGPRLTTIYSRRREGWRTRGWVR